MTLSLHKENNLANTFSSSSVPLIVGEIKLNSLRKKADENFLEKMSGRNSDLREAFDYAKHCQSYPSNESITITTPEFSADKEDENLTKKLKK